MFDRLAAAQLCVPIEAMRLIIAPSLVHCWFRQSRTNLIGEGKESASKEVDDRSFPGFIKQLATDLVGLTLKSILQVLGGGSSKVILIPTR
jgi:hypothetical protein